MLLIGKMAVTGVTIELKLMGHKILDLGTKR